MKKQLAFALGTATLVLSHTALAQQQPYGGLTVPPPQQGTPGQQGNSPYVGVPPGNSQPNATEQQLRNSEADDSGRGLEFAFLNAEAGFQTLHLGALGASCSGGATTTCTSTKASENGASLGAGVGARLLFFTLGVRGRMGLFSDYKYLSIDPEVGFHVPLGNMEPYGFIGGGYSKLSGLPDFITSAHGFNLRFGGGLDYYVVPEFSVGAAVSIEYVKMTVTAQEAPDLSGSTGISGYDFNASAVFGLHFLTGVRASRCSSAFSSARSRGRFSPRSLSARWSGGSRAAIRAWAPAPQRSRRFSAQGWASSPSLSSAASFASPASKPHRASTSSCRS